MGFHSHWGSLFGYPTFYHPDFIDGIFHEINGHLRNPLIGGTHSIYFGPIFEALVSGNIPTKYGQTYGTNVPPF